MNIAIIIGRLTKDPDTRYGQNSQMAVSKFTVAVDRGKDKEGNDKGADFINCVAFGKTAESIEKFFHKGNRIGVTGHITTGSYEDKDGRKVYTTEVAVDRFEFVESKKEAPSKDDIPSGFSKLEDDIPFE